MTEILQEKFEAIVKKEGKFKFVEIPFLPKEIWGAKPRYYVTGTINDIPVRGTLGAFGQDHFLRLSATWLKDSGIKIGTNVLVKLSIDERRLSEKK